MTSNYKKILILGANGYIGTALFNHLRDKNEVFGVDNNLRAKNVASIGGESLVEHAEVADLQFDISEDYGKLRDLIQSLQPEVIINLAQQPSAPFSMKDVTHATESQRNNIIGGLNLLWAVKEVNPNIHIIQLGTAGEYPDWLYEGMKVPEGSRITVKYQDKDWTIPTPRYAGSWYHFSKLHASYNADYACRIWGLRITDINQGIVYGHLDGTRFDYDEYFGTVINRFVTQAVAGMPLTIYGDGFQTRSFIHLQNSVDAIKLLIDTPADPGEYRVIQQLTDVKTVSEIADMVMDATNCEVQHIENPRAEMSRNEFTFEAKELKTLGLVPVAMEDEIKFLIDLVTENKDKIRKEVIMPKTKWK